MKSSRRKYFLIGVLGLLLVLWLLSRVEFIVRVP
jgi:hypothetical protein